MTRIARGSLLGPYQVEALNQGFTPNAAQLHEAQAIVSAFESAERTGSRVAEANGIQVNFALYETALSLIEWARLCAERDASKQRARTISGAS